MIMVALLGHPASHKVYDLEMRVDVVVAEMLNQFLICAGVRLHMHVRVRVRNDSRMRMR